MRKEKQYLTKRLILSLIAVLTSVSMWAQPFMVGNIKYTVNKDDPSTVTFNGFVTATQDEIPGPVGAFNLPSTVTNNGKTYTVTNIGNGAFASCTNMTSVVIPNTIITIGKNAFDSCSGLTSLTLPNSVTSIGDEVFYSCVNLESINLSNRLTTISKNTFTLCTSLLSVVIPNSVETIADNGFWGCASLMSITIPNSVTSIGMGAFEECESLTAVNIPNSVKGIGDRAFANCESLVKVNIFAPSLDEYGNYVFSNNAKNRKIYVVSGSEDTYKTWWIEYADAIEAITMDFGLSNSGENSGVIESNDGKVVDVMLYDRTLYKDGDWNTICLPFDVDIDNSPLAGATARTLTSASITENFALSLSFGSPVSTLEAGVPYLIKWNGDDDIIDPIFYGVTISKDIYVYDNKVSGDARVRFIGTNQSVAFSDDDNVLLLGSKNTLYYASSGMAIGAQRAYFRIGEDNVSNVRRITSFNFEFGDEATSIDACEAQGEESSWYTLQGVKLGDKPVQNGVYIHNGKKVIIK